jgi:hypothetical protein
MPLRDGKHKQNTCAPPEPRPWHPDARTGSQWRTDGKSAADIIAAYRWPEAGAALRRALAKNAYAIRRILNADKWPPRPEGSESRLACFWFCPSRLSPLHPPVAPPSLRPCSTPSLGVTNCLPTGTGCLPPHLSACLWHALYTVWARQSFSLENPWWADPLPDGAVPGCPLSGNLFEEKIRQLRELATLPHPLHVPDTPRRGRRAVVKPSAAAPEPNSTLAAPTAHAAAPAAPRVPQRQPPPVPSLPPAPLSCFHSTAPCLPKEQRNTK